jgi:hypothetical protein
MGDRHGPLPHRTSILNFLSNKKEFSRDISFNFKIIKKGFDSISSVFPALYGTRGIPFLEP